VTLTAFPAACGDCLQVQYVGDDGPHTILVDGGLGSAFGRGLGTRLGRAPSPTTFDVAVVTHIDLDHIEGVLRALGDGRLDAKDFWFNGRDQLQDHFQGEASRGIRQGDALSRLIPDDHRNQVAGGSALFVSDTGPTEYRLPGGATAVLLSPSEERLRALLRRWPQPTRGGAQSIDELLTAFADQPERGAGTFGKDSSVANGSSIAFLFEHHGVSILFTADAFAAELAASITKLLAERHKRTLEVDVFKLPHHGSRQNITDDLLSLIQPQQVLVCTDGSKFNHPDEDALDKIRNHYPDVPILFTDATAVTTRRAARVHGDLPSSSPRVIAL
jgi:hypothetical protein